MSGKIQVTGICRTAEEASGKLMSWLAEQERLGIKVEPHKLSMLVGRADFGTFHSVEYDPDAKPPKFKPRGPNEALPLP